VRENGNLIALGLNGESVSLEPGGQLELSGAPRQTLHQTCDEVHIHLAQVKEVGNELGIGVLGLGFQPKWKLADIPMMPKGRYGIMRAYMPKRGGRGLDMMFRTCTVQVNLDFGDEADMVRKFRVGLALQPIATALFANSPFVEGRPAGFVSYRANAWADTDPDRTGLIPFVFEDGMGYERYVDYALGVPMYFVYRDGRYVDASGQSFRDFLAGRLPALPGAKPTLRDWADHLTTLFPEARLKQYLEMRGADGGPWARLCALPALWTGLLYDAAARDAAWELCRRWDAPTRAKLHAEVPKLGLKAKVGNRTVQDIARDLLDIAAAGLDARRRLSSSGDTETHFLRPLYRILDSKRTPAEELLELYAGCWKGSVDPVFTEFAY
jgi:glutamate--cysteine ligase